MAAAGCAATVALADLCMRRASFPSWDIRPMDLPHSCEIAEKETTGMSDLSRGPGTPDGNGIVAHEAQVARAAIATALTEIGIAPPARGIDLRPVPFAGTWGVATSVCHAIAGDLVLTELESSGALDGLSKKEAKQKASEATRTRAQELAESIATRVRQSNGFSQVEAANGIVNIYFDANVVASHLIGEVLRLGPEYGKGATKTERVMVEHSQPNTHKIFHVGHLRNSCLGIAVSNVLSAAGYPVMQATYPGDIGM